MARKILMKLAGMFNLSCQIVITKTSMIMNLEKLLQDAISDQQNQNGCGGFIFNIHVRSPIVAFSVQRL